MASSASMDERFVAAMVLSGVGDAMGYKNGNWEFCHSGAAIHRELEQLGGVGNLRVKLPGWPVSDDTVMHLATAEGLKAAGKDADKETMYGHIAREYKECFGDMGGRAPGITCAGGVHQLRPGRKNGYRIPFNSRGGGCGAAMRAMCIGLRYSKPEEEHELIALSVESGRMTHHHPTGYLGSLAAALFTAYAVRDVPIVEWGFNLVNVLPKVLEYVKKSGHCVKENTEAWFYFEAEWGKYLKLRCIEDGKGPVVFPEKYGIKERDAFYKSCSFSGWGGSSGHDAPMIAYDALLGAEGNWANLCSRSMFHSGDSDSTGVIAACCYGAMFGFDGVPECNYVTLEYRDRLKKVGLYFFDLFNGGDGNVQDTDKHELNLPNVPEVGDSTTDENTDSENDVEADDANASLDTYENKTKQHPIKRDSSMSQDSCHDDSEKHRKL